MDVVPMTPYSTVKLLNNVPLDNSYKDTLDFADVSAQYNYFNGKKKYEFFNCTPVKLQNAIRLPVPADKIYDCNYVMFQNANYDSPQWWFYAFITKIEYVGTNMCQVFFEIDVMQTWQFKYTVKPSFVIREHTSDDTIGSNLIAENLELGEYISLGSSFTDVLTETVIVVASTADVDGTDVVGDSYGNIYSGLKLIAFAVPSAVNDMINNLTTQNKKDAIVSIFMFPKNFVTLNGEAPITMQVTQPKNLTDIDGYVPKNNKLFTYPYNFLYVTNFQGNSANYPYEYFEDAEGNCVFGITCDMSCNPQVTLYPYNYKGMPQNFNEKMVLDGYPQCSYSTDTFKAWLAQNGASTAVSVLGSALSIGAGAMTGNPAGIVSGALGIAGTLAQIHATATLPPQAHGASGSTGNLAIGLKDFEFINMSIRSEYAKIIDEYFSMFGYATHRVKVPNTKSRPSWNYVKTHDSKIVGTIPFNDITKIRSIFDNGVTFWHGDFVGDYTRNNQL